MNRVAFFVIVGILIAAISFLGVRFFLFQRKGSKAGLKVTSVPTASVFLDNRNIGRTPYEDKIEPGEYTLKLIPEITEGEVMSWQSKIKLTPGLLTYVNRELGKTELASAGEILTLEKIDEKVAEISVVTTPDGAKVKLDGIDRGVAPTTIKNVEPGDHQLTIESAGFKERTIKIMTTSGYKLIADVQLALSSETPASEETGEKQEEAGSEKEKGGAQVKILDTPTGWLRVRSKPTTASTESAKVNPGEIFPLLDEQSGWYKIEYEEGKTGWIFGKYAEKVE